MCNYSLIKDIKTLEKLGYEIKSINNKKTKNLFYKLLLYNSNKNCILSIVPKEVFIDNILIYLHTDLNFQKDQKLKLKFKTKKKDYFIIVDPYSNNFPKNLPQFKIITKKKINYKLLIMKIEYLFLNMYNSWLDTYTLNFLVLQIRKFISKSNI